MLEFEWHPEPIVVAEDVDLLAAQLNDMSAPLKASMIPVIGAVENRFEEEGPGWAQWAESYAARAAETNQGGILWRYGDLVEGATSVDSYLVTDHEIVWTGADAPPYWIFHQEGTSKMPARPFIGLDDQAENEIVAIFGAWMDGAIAASRVSGGGLRSSGGQFMSHPLASFGFR
jgi:phage gpG-like protein